MKTEKRNCIISIACALMCAPAFAQSLPALSHASDSHALLAHFEHVAEADLKAQYLLCDRISSQRMLSSGEAVACSNVADVLKTRSFGGDFNALIAWWRLHRDEGEPADGETQ